MRNISINTNELIPSKYRGKIIPHDLKKFKKKSLYRKLNRKARKFMKYFLSYDDAVFKEDYKILNDDVFKEESYDSHFVAFNMYPLRYDEMSRNLSKLFLLRRLQELTILDSLLRKRLGTDKLSKNELKKLLRISKSFRDLLDKFLILCIRKNLLDRKTKVESTVSKLTADISLYYGGITF